MASRLLAGAKANSIQRLVVTVVVLVVSVNPAWALQTAPGLHRGASIMSDGIPRTFDYYVPATLGGDAALVMLLHGHLGDAAHMTGESGTAAPYRLWMEIADTANLICVYPEGEFSPVEDSVRGWNDCRQTAQGNPETDDGAFIMALVDTFTNSFSIASDAIYAAGTSNGGFMTMRLAVEHPETFSAVAIIVASMPITSECPSPGVPMNVLFMNGTADPIMPFDGGPMGSALLSRGDAMATYDAVSSWLDVNGIASAPVIDSLADLTAADSCRVVTHSWHGGSYGKSVVLYEVVGGGHTEPSKVEKYKPIYKNLVAGPQNNDIEMAEEVWKFFSNTRQATAQKQARHLELPRPTEREYGAFCYTLRGRKFDSAHPAGRGVRVLVPSRSPGMGRLILEP